MDVKYEGEEKMSRNPVLYKTLVVGVIVLFIGLGIQPAYALTNDEQIIKEENNNSEGHWGFGVIECYIEVKINSPTWPFMPPIYMYIPLTGTIITCKDLDTGNIRIGIAKFGLKSFRFLPLGHDYKLTFGILLGEERYIDNFNGFARVDILIDSTW